MTLKSSLLRLCLALCTIVLFGSCMKDKLTKTYTIFTPVYQSKAEVLASVKNGPVRSVSTPGKIYLYGHYIFLNEVNKGVHVIDNQDPASPKIKAFIKIPGNVDIAVKGNYLYADMFSDLVTIDISDPLNTRLVKTVSKVFPDRVYGLGFSRDTTQVIVDWVAKDTTISQDIDITNGCGNCVFNYASTEGSFKSGGPSIGGSMARFTIVNNYMYTVGISELTAISLEEPAAPRVEAKSSVGIDIETIYPFKDKLFIGSTTGMFIYSIANPSSPARLGVFTHGRACDPVVADDDYAFVTLRTGTLCGGTSNVLDVVDVSNVLSPHRVAMHQLVNPHGLSKDGNLLFICDGRDGLKMFDASNVRELVLLHHQKGLDTYDVIAWNKRLIVVSKTGLDQFDYSNGSSLKHLSTITINQKK